MKKAFTLAEVLITLAIIGVVAALTIPTVVHKYQQKAMYTQFMKAYNTFNNVFDLSVADNGYPDTWTAEQSDVDAAVKQYIEPYLKISKACSNFTDCFAETYTNLSGEDIGTHITGGYPASDPVLLTDGSAVKFELEISSGMGFLDRIFIIFDTNGKKGPNVLGRDIFRVEYLKDYDNKKWIWNNDYEKGGEEGSTPGELTESDCDPSSANEDNGYGCPGRLLTEGKMNY